jgi:hypothetical protein
MNFVRGFISISDEFDCTKPVSEPATGSFRITRPGSDAFDLFSANMRAALGFAGSDGAGAPDGVTRLLCIGGAGQAPALRIGLPDGYCENQADERPPHFQIPLIWTQ